jgi:crotonobetainyl-CoA:carnitine CoA-transferase CaiB-like acyl-CoA transferase
LPFELSRTPAVLRSAPPRLGEHTSEILASLGYTAEQIETFRRQEVI